MADETPTDPPAKPTDPDRDVEWEAIEAELRRLGVSGEEYARLLFVAVSDVYRDLVPPPGRVFYLVPFSWSDLLEALQGLSDGAGPNAVADAIAALKARWESASRERRARYGSE
jgi:hypothetical protein